MATFVPERHRTLPRSSAERRALEWLVGLDDSWTVLHSVGLARHAHKRWAEADIVVIGHRGVLVLEVKGGRVLRRAGEWGFQDRSGRTDWRREGPYEQVGGAEAVLRSHLREAGVLPRAVPCGWAVLAPDSRLEGVGPEAWSEVTLDARDPWPDPTSTVNRFLSVWAQRSGADGRLDDRGVRRIAASLRGDVAGSLSLREKLRAFRDASLRVTGEQFDPLHAVRHNRRLVVLTPRPAEAVAAVPVVLADLPDRGRDALVLSPSPAAASFLGEAANCDVAYRDGDGLAVQTAGRSVRHSVDLAAGRRWRSLVVVGPETFPEGLVARLCEARLVGGTASGITRVFADPHLNVSTEDWAREAAVVELETGTRASQEVLSGVALLTGRPLLKTSLTGPTLTVEWSDTETDDAARRLVEAALLDHEPDEVCVLDVGEVNSGGPAPALSGLGRVAGQGEAVRAWPDELLGLDFECLVVLNADMRTASGRHRLYRALGCARADLRLVLPASNRALFVKAAVMTAEQGGSAGTAASWSLH